MKIALTLFALAMSAFGQAPIAPVSVPVDFQVHILSADTVKAKYGHALPKSVYLGSVTGVNRGATTAVFGQGYVLQELRSQGYRALSQQDARAIVLRAQRAGFIGWWNHYSGTGVKVLDDLNNLQIFKVIQLPLGAAAGLATADAIAKSTHQDLSVILADIYQSYDTDGIQPLMQLPPGGSLAGTLLFELAGAKPDLSPAPVITVQVPVAK